MQQMQAVRPALSGRGKARPNTVENRPAVNLDEGLRPRNDERADCLAGID
jgi:hypothetical protein